MAITDHIAGLLPDLISIRHDLHEYPEIGFEYQRTSGIVATSFMHWASRCIAALGASLLASIVEMRTRLCE
ncbi:hypothetical protein [Agrobacterium larrymoorei]|uniref:Amidohydrolase n=1 Tax=Agrobacterium larrymoorei TaxID=160699 RepID=A0AAF0KH51_9HYPH|nr:hypothetical protein [Agrobacterium larrymoorei]WHA44082.1 hypothetical protein CFBP5477_021960 [Agrobacterium larrymoorei]